MITVAGLTNVEVNLRVDSFPVNYQPVSYPYFGVDASTGGVGFNIAKALTTLGSDVAFLTLGASDASARIVNADLDALHLKECCKIDNLKATPQSVNIYDNGGRRSIYCDLKDIQENVFDIDKASDAIKRSSAAVLCNINFARPMLKVALESQVPIITDVHVISDPTDEYDYDFLSSARVLFLSNEGILNTERDFLLKLATLYKNLDIIIAGMGADGAMLYDRDNDTLTLHPAVKTGTVVNTTGAGDALLSAFTHFYVKGYPTAEALRLAQKLASIKICTSGAANGFVSEKKL